MKNDLNIYSSVASASSCLCFCMIISWWFPISLYHLLYFSGVMTAHITWVSLPLLLLIFCSSSCFWMTSPNFTGKLNPPPPHPTELRTQNSHLTPFLFSTCIGNVTCDARRNVRFQLKVQKNHTKVIAMIQQVDLHSFSSKWSDLAELPCPDCVWGDACEERITSLMSLAGRAIISLLAPWARPSTRKMHFYPKLSLYCRTTSHDHCPRQRDSIPRLPGCPHLPGDQHSPVQPHLAARWPGCPPGASSSHHEQPFAGDLQGDDWRYRLVSLHCCKWGRGFFLFRLPRRTRWGHV